eukprot:3059516-Rhodomonas_salina.1
MAVSLPRTHHNACRVAWDTLDTKGALTSLTKRHGGVEVGELLGQRSMTSNTPLVSPKQASRSAACTARNSFGAIDNKQ